VTLRLATRGSVLAVAQAKAVAGLLGGATLVEVSSDGEPGDKDRFVRGVERALLAGDAEIGVHSAKDVPSQIPSGLVLAGAPARADPSDAWVGAGGSLDAVPAGARVGTASLRRRSQLLAARPDLRVGELHGNVDTRLGRLGEGAFDAIVLAAAGLQRLGREGEIGFRLPAAQMTPAPGQGILVLQTRSDDEAARDAAAGISDNEALAELTAERAVVGLLEASCATPIGVHAQVDGDRLGIDAYVGLADGSEWIRDRVEGALADPAAAGEELAERLRAVGAGELLERADAAAA
jgi:hydroxymethylbilane synthase